MCLAQGPQRSDAGLESSTLPLSHCAPYVRVTTGGFATIAINIQTLYINFFYQHGRFVNKVHMGEGFAHLMQ